MKRLGVFAFFTALAALISSGPALAVCATGSMPFQLQNGQVADATQVMANFNQITTGIQSSCAGSGVNNDITSLGALSTPLSPTQGGSAVFTGGVTGGSVNAQSLTVNINFSLTTGYHISGFFSFTNTGHLTMQVNGGAATPVWRKMQFGVSQTQGGEAIVGHPFEMVYNGSSWILLGETILIGETKLMSSGNATPPPGYLIADGSSFLCATFQDLCNVIGTTYGGTAGQPFLPDMRGRVLAGLDTFGTAAGAANRLTSAATGCGTAFTALGVTCSNGNQSHTQLVVEIATHNHGITDPGHNHEEQGSDIGGPNVFMTANQGNQVMDGGMVTQSSTTGITINNNGSSQPMPIVNPNFGQIMIIRF